jgi:TolA-binding protein
LNEVSDREKAMEYMLESLIKMLGKSNHRVDDLNKRVLQLESLIRETVMQNSHTQKLQTAKRFSIMN